jgi:hypothetical protein
MRKDGITPGLRRHIGGVSSLSLFYKIDRSTQKLTTSRIHSFDIRPSIFDIPLGLSSSQAAVLRFAFHYIPSTFNVHHFRGCKPLQPLTRLSLSKAHLLTFPPPAFFLFRLTPDT